MSIHNTAIVNTNVAGDGTTTTFSLNLLSDTYTVSSETINLFINSRRFPSPSGVVNVSGSYTVALTGTTLTFTFNTPPPSGTLTGIFAILTF